MNEAEAYGYLARRLGLQPETIPFLVEITLDLSIINPILPETARKLGRILDLRPGQKILDLACGKAGVTLPLVNTYQVNLLGLDLLPDFIREAWSRAEYAGLHHLCRFKIADAAQFVSQTQDQWDAVFVLGAMTFMWEDLASGVSAVRPLIKPHGHLVIGEGYFKSESVASPDDPFMSQEETTAVLGRAGRIIEVLDDGRPGWEAMWTIQRKSMERLSQKSPENQELLSFLEGWRKRQDWETENLGFAVWVMEVD